MNNAAANSSISNSSKAPAVRRKTQKYANHVKSAPMSSLSDAVSTMACGIVGLADQTRALIALCTEKFGKVMAPAANCVVIPGGDSMIVWKILPGIISNAPKFIDIEIRDANTNFPVQTVVTNLANTGYFIWNVDQHMESISMPCRLFIGNITDSSSTEAAAAFQIYSDPFKFATNEPEKKAPMCSKKSVARKKCNLAWSASTENDNSVSSQAAKKSVVEKSASIQEREKVEPRTVAGSFLSVADAQNVSPADAAAAILPLGVSVDWSLYPEFTYACIYMNSTRIRRGLREILRTETITSDTVLTSGESAGLFCVCYLLQTYLKSKISPTVEFQIASGTYRPPQTHERIWQQLELIWQQKEMCQKLAQRLPLISSDAVEREGDSSISSSSSIAQVLPTTPKKNKKNTPMSARSQEQQQPKKKRIKTLDQALENMQIAED